MKKILQSLALSILLITPVLANQDGVVVRTARVYSAADLGSPTVGELAAGSRVSLFTRRGSWQEVFAEDQAIIGWVRSYQVRAGSDSIAAAAVQTQDSRGFLSGLAAFSRKASSFFKSNSGSTSSGTATIGVRGLSEAEINSAQADFAELEKMKGYASNRSRVRTFARDGRLQARSVAHFKRQ